MALPHASPGVAWNIAPLGEELAQARSVALFKSRQLEVLRLVLQAGEGLPAHKVRGEITIQFIEGEVSIDLHGSSRRLATAELMYLGAGELHAVTASTDSSLVVTIVLPRDAPSVAGMIRSSRR